MFKITLVGKYDDAATFVVNKGQADDVYVVKAWKREDNNLWEVEVDEHTPTEESTLNDCPYVEGGFCKYHQVFSTTCDGMPSFGMVAEIVSQAMPRRQSYACYMNTAQDNSEGSYHTNGIRFATAEEANKYGQRKAWNWYAVLNWIAVPTDDPVNYEFVGETLKEC